MLLRDIPGYALYFIPYTIFCDLLKPDTTSSPHPCSIWLAGGLAGQCVVALSVTMVQNSLILRIWSTRSWRRTFHDVEVLMLCFV